MTLIEQLMLHFVLQLKLYQDLAPRTAYVNLDVSIALQSIVYPFLSMLALELCKLLASLLEL